MKFISDMRYQHSEDGCVKISNQASSSESKLSLGMLDESLFLEAHVYREQEQSCKTAPWEKSPYEG